MVTDPRDEWRDVPGFPGYRVSRSGRLLGRHGFEVARRDEGSRSYRKTAARDASGVLRTLLVHRAVLLAFVGPCPPGCVASLVDGRKQDCRLENVTWESPAENARRRLEDG